MSGCLGVHRLRFAELLHDLGAAEGAGAGSGVGSAGRSAGLASWS